jgi:hypothetical protein
MDELVRAIYDCMSRNGAEARESLRMATKKFNCELSRSKERREVEYQEEQKKKCEHGATDCVQAVRTDQNSSRNGLFHSWDSPMICSK